MIGPWSDKIRTNLNHEENKALVSTLNNLQPFGKLHVAKLIV